MKKLTLQRRNEGKAGQRQYGSSASNSIPTQKESKFILKDNSNGCFERNI